MDMTQCDVCGALADADATGVGRGVLAISKRRAPKDPFEMMAARMSPRDFESNYDLCADCAAAFVALIESQRGRRA